MQILVHVNVLMMPLIISRKLVSVVSPVTHPSTESASRLNVPADRQIILALLIIFLAAPNATAPAETVKEGFVMSMHVRTDILLSKWNINGIGAAAKDSDAPSKTHLVIQARTKQSVGKTTREKNTPVARLRFRENVQAAYAILPFVPNS